MPHHLDTAMAQGIKPTQLLGKFHVTNLRLGGQKGPMVIK